MLSVGVEGNEWSELGVIFGNGWIVVFISWVMNLVFDDMNDMNDVFVYDWCMGIIECVNVDSVGN